MSLKEGHSDGTAFSMSFLSIISEGKLLTVNMGCIPNYQLPIQKSSALLLCQRLVKDVANIDCAHKTKAYGKYQ